MMDRRTFLKQAAATPLVFGLTDLFGQEAPEWWTAALKRMKATGRYGVVLIAPADGEERTRMAAALISQLERKAVETRELFVEAVFLCLVPELAERVHANLEKENLILLDPDAKRVTSEMVAIETLESAENFREKIAGLLHGERLEKRARAIEKALSKEARGALEKLDSDDLDEADSAMSTLVRLADGIAPYLVWARQLEKSDDRRARLATVILKSFEGASEEAPGPRYPFGAELRQELDDPCPGCGRSSTPLKMRRVLRWLSK